MKKEIFLHYCQCLHQIYGIPVRVYKNDLLILKEELVPLPAAFEDLLGKDLRMRASATEEDFVLFQSVNLLSYGYVRNKNSTLSVLLGPIPSVEINRDSFLGSTLKIKDVPISDAVYQSIENYLNAIPIMQIGRVGYILSSLIAVTQGKIVTPDSMKVVKPSPEFDVPIHREVMYHFEDLVFGEIEKSNYYDYERRFLTLIKNGMTDQLTRMWQEASGNVMTSGSEYTSLRTAKDKCIIAIGIVSNAVLETGIPQEDIYRMRNAYITKTENCHDIKKLVDLRFNMMVDFCQQVEYEKYKNVSDVPIVNQAVAYINEHCDRRITLQELADHVHASKSYFCSEFSKSMGVSVIAYIQAQKIKRAKQFLVLSEKPLSEISELLSFSSQSYFQNIFKRITGMTPTQFRKQNKMSGS